MTDQQSKLSKLRLKAILTVEDNQGDADLVRHAFKKYHMINEDVTTSAGDKAPEYLFARGKYTSKNMHPLSEVVLLDLKQPKVDGLEVLQRPRPDERTKHHPMVILTSSSEEGDLVDSYTVGANSCVQKPVDCIQFSEAAGQLGIYGLLLNKSPGSSGGMH